MYLLVLVLTGKRQVKMIKNKKRAVASSGDEDETPKKKKKVPMRTDINTARRVFAGLDDAGKFWKPKSGNNIIRILPSNREDGNFAYHSLLHHGFKVEGQNRA